MNNIVSSITNIITEGGRKIPLIYKVHKKPPGLSPGTLIHTGIQKIEKPIIGLIEFNDEQFTEKEYSNIEEAFSGSNPSLTTWINIYGLHDINLLEKLGAQFNIHSLVLEDIVNTYQRPKTEAYDNQVFCVLKAFQLDQETKEIDSEQVSFILGENYIISFQEKKNNYFVPVRERLRKGKGKIRKAGAGYLLYALIDAIVDRYFELLEKLGDNIESLENELIEDPKPENRETIYKLRRELLLLRKSVWPLREMLSSLQKDESELLHENTEVFFRDVHDHAIQIIDTIETYREIISGMLDTYLSSLSNRMNEVMKVLTIIATIFIPLTFLAGVYGMNFVNFPELRWEWLYPWGFWGIILLLTGLMLWYFKRKRWF
jgi:magnesium transporter